MKRFTVAIQVDVVVIDHNAEMADMGNPRGEVYGEQFSCVVTNRAGRQWVHIPSMRVSRHSGEYQDVQSRMESDATSIQAAVNRAKMDPLDFFETYAMYGTPAYLNEVAEMTDEQRAQ